jgi:hypothetical protein
MPQVVLEPMIPAFERAKIVHALDYMATVIGSNLDTNTKTERVLQGESSV